VRDGRLFADQFFNVRRQSFLMFNPYQTPLRPTFSTLISMTYFPRSLAYSYNFLAFAKTGQCFCPTKIPLKRFRDDEWRRTDEKIRIDDRLRDIAARPCSRRIRPIGR